MIIEYSYDDYYVSHGEIYEPDQLADYLYDRLTYVINEDMMIFAAPNLECVVDFLRDKE